MTIWPIYQQLKRQKKNMNKPLDIEYFDDKYNIEAE